MVEVMVAMKEDDLVDCLAHRKGAWLVLKPAEVKVDY